MVCVSKGTHIGIFKGLGKICIRCNYVRKYEKLHLGYAYSCYSCHQAIDKTRPYVVKRVPTKKGMVSKYYHPECYRPKRTKPTFTARIKKMENQVAGVYLGLGDRKPEVKIGIG